MEQLSNTLLRDQELRQQNTSLREQWISGITHDLKTPLSSIKGYAHMLSEDSYGWDTQEVRKFSRIMMEKSAHMDSLINDLSLTYRLSAGVQPPEGEEIELNKWLRVTLDKAADQPLLDKSRIRFIPADKEVYASLHVPWLERVVMNITANALLHNPPDTIMTVTLLGEEAGKRMKIIFSDNGKGMDASTASRLFERYYRGTDSSALTEGSGLGMAISKGLIESMGGEINVLTAPGSGTEISLCWPIISDGKKS